MIDSGLLYVVVFWLLVFLIHRYFKTSRKYSFAYTEGLLNNGITLSPFQIRWQTVVFNKIFSKIGRCSPKFSLIWFSLGAIFAVFAMVLSMGILTFMLYQSIKKTNPDQLLQPVMPGMNLPWSQVSYYLITLIISGTFHEVGHAIAAVRENVRVVSFGVFILFLYPGAFVELHTEQIEIISPIRRLRIYAAGVWHNFVLALVAYFLSISLSMWLSPFFIINEGVLVTYISPESSIASRLPVGDTIQHVNSCPVRNTQDWYDCLLTIQNSPVEGYCNPQNYIKTHNTSLAELTENYGEPDCCNDTSSYRFCFWYQTAILPTTDSIGQKLFNANRSIRTSLEYISKFTEHSCLPARQVLSGTLCQNNTDCLNTGDLCLKPLTKNTTRVIRLSHKKGREVLFVGEPRELSATILLSNYVPIYTMPFLNLPKHLESLCLYLVSISAALALLNMVPCFYLDGHHTLEVLLEIVLPSQRRLRLQIQTIVLFAGTCSLLMNVVIALTTLL